MLRTLTISKDHTALNPATHREYPVRFWHKTPELQEALPISDEITPATGIAMTKPIYQVGQAFQTTPPTTNWPPAAYAFITNAAARALNLNTSLNEHLEDAIEQLNAHQRHEIYTLRIEGDPEAPPIELNGIPSTPTRHVTDNVINYLQSHGLLNTEPDDAALDAIEQAFRNGSAKITLNA